MHFLHLFQWCTKMWSWSRKMKDYEITFARLQHVTFWLLGQLMPNFFRRLNSRLTCCRLPTKREKSGNYHYGFYRKDCKPLNTEIGSKSLCTHLLNYTQLLNHTRLYWAEIEMRLSWNILQPNWHYHWLSSMLPECIYNPITTMMGFSAMSWQH